jgi:hypothetical protein
MVDQSDNIAVQTATKDMPDDEDLFETCRRSRGPHEESPFAESEEVTDYW